MERRRFLQTLGTGLAAGFLPGIMATSAEASQAAILTGNLAPLAEARPDTGPVIKLIGIGRFGTRLLDTLVDLRIPEISSTLAIDTDDRVLERSQAEQRFVLGPGLATGANCSLGRALARQHGPELTEAIGQADVSDSGWLGWRHWQRCPAGGGGAGPKEGHHVHGDHPALLIRNAASRPHGRPCLAPTLAPRCHVVCPAKPSDGGTHWSRYHIDGGDELD